MADAAPKTDPLPMTDDGRLDLSKLALFKDVAEQGVTDPDAPELDPDPDAPKRAKLVEVDELPAAKPAPLPPLKVAATEAEVVDYVREHAASFPALTELYGSPSEVFDAVAGVMHSKLARADKKTAQNFVDAVVSKRLSGREILSSFEVWAAQRLEARDVKKSGAKPAASASKKAATKAPAPKATAAKPSAPHVTRTFPKDYDRWDDKRQNAWLAAWSEKYAQRKG